MPAMPNRHDAFTRDGFPRDTPGEPARGEAGRGEERLSGGGAPATDTSGAPDLSTVWLRVFLDVARHGSFTVAARTLGWTQSAVSRQISALEAALGGAPLFDRLPRGCG
jgi:hypothetical protein